MKIFYIFSLIILCACQKEGQELKNSTNPNFYVSLLFEVDNIKIYRFQDEGRSHYFASKGITLAEQTKYMQIGKTSYVSVWDGNIYTCE